MVFDETWCENLSLQKFNVSDSFNEVVLHLPIHDLSLWTELQNVKKHFLLFSLETSYYLMPFFC